jgi:hypothetical protein
MTDFKKYVEPNRKDFDKDPFGYSALARHKWGMARTIAGFPVDISKPATSEELKNPLLWLCQAHALSQAALVVIKNEPDFKDMPQLVRSVCDSQYCAVGLMLVGYSLEICLKAMMIMQNGIESYIEAEKQHRHHRLHELAKFVPDLNEKDKAILTVLTHFVYWAGRYPDPGYGKEYHAEEIFMLSEKFEISAKDLFILSSRIMSEAKKVADAL